VAARGLDVAHVGLVINVELPETPQWLTHRIGRTARNGAEGTALTFLSDDDMEKWQRLQRLGAPSLRWVDREVLLDSGTLAFLDAPVVVRPQRVRTAPAYGRNGARSYRHPSARRSGGRPAGPRAGSSPGGGQRVQPRGN
jgi:superfamily II DNA/RNA helicase